MERWKRALLLAAFLLGFGYRLVACVQTPLETSDVLRNLGYASHALEGGFDIYTTLGIDFEFELWARYNVWNGQTYIYPPVTLLFFYAFSLLGLGIFWVKLALTLIELGCALVLYKRISALAAVLYFCAPISMWYTSHEGQFEALQTLFLMLTVLLVTDRRWFLAGVSLALSIQVKQFGVLLAPWILSILWQTRRDAPLKTTLVRLALGLGLGFLPFSGYYMHRPDLLLIPLTSGVDIRYNPFAWSIWDPEPFAWNPRFMAYWNAVFTYLPLISLGFVALRRRNLSDIMAASPLVAFWVLIKSLHWGQFWYPMLAPGLLLPLERHRKLVTLLLACYFLLGIRSFTMMIGLTYGQFESAENRAVMEQCMFVCDPQQLITEVSLDLPRRVAASSQPRAVAPESALLFDMCRSRLPVSGGDDVPFRDWRLHRLFLSPCPDGRCPRYRL